MMTKHRVTIAEAIEAMAGFPLRRASVERVDIARSAGRIVAKPIVALEDVPPFARSRVDGYAVQAADVAAATEQRPVRLQLVGEVHMGKSAPAALRPGQAIRIATGGMLPAGADAVVMVEDTSQMDAVVEIRDESHCTDNITEAAADIRAGEGLLEAGTVLNAGEIGMLAATGIGQVDVYAKPFAGLLVTGDEIVPPGAPRGPGEIRDINRYSISAALAAMGFAPKAYPRVADERGVFADAFASALNECDVVVISGGSSVGERDYAADVVRAAGEPGIIVHGVRAKPGRPTMLAVVGDKPVIGLPGNPVSALVMLESVGKPALLRMFDKKVETLPYSAFLQTPIDTDGKLEHRICVKLARAADGRVTATPLFGTSAQMHTVGNADAMVVVPVGVTNIPKGARVDCIPFTWTSALR